MYIFFIIRPSRVRHIFCKLIRHIYIDYANIYVIQKDSRLWREVSISPVSGRSYSLVMYSSKRYGPSNSMNSYFFMKYCCSLIILTTDLKLLWVGVIRVIMLIDILCRWILKCYTCMLSRKCKTSWIIVSFSLFKILHRRINKCIQVHCF